MSTVLVDRRQWVRRKPRRPPASERRPHRSHHRALHEERGERARDAARCRSGRRQPPDVLHGRPHERLRLVAGRGRLRLRTTRRVAAVGFGSEGGSGGDRSCTRRLAAGAPRRAGREGEARGDDLVVRRCLLRLSTARGAVRRDELVEPGSWGHERVREVEADRRARGWDFSRRRAARSSSPSSTLPASSVPSSARTRLRRR
jgi:hypothetical protein